MPGGRYGLVEGKELGTVLNNRAVIDRLAAYENTGLEPEEVAAIESALIGKLVAKINEINGVPIKRLNELAQAEKDGRLVVLPCKVGDTVYLTDRDRVVKAEVTCIRPFVFQNEIEFRGNAAWCFEDPFHHDGRILEQDVFIVFGKDAYLTREEAEAALAKQKEKQE